MSDQIYTIKARKVVPGMQYSCQSLRAPRTDDDYNTIPAIEYRESDDWARGTGQPNAGPIHDVGFKTDGTMVVWGTGGDPVCVRLPGPSPRELLCTCTHYVLHARSEVPPAGHLPRCPVAPNADRVQGPIHGGLRLWPVGGTAWGGPSWGWHLPGGRAVSASVLHNIRTMMPDEPDAAYFEGLLVALFEPPTIPDPDPMRMPWDPYDPMELL